MSEENEKVITVNNEVPPVEVKNMTPDDWARYHHFMGPDLTEDELLLPEPPKPERPRRVVKRGFNRTK